MGKKESKGLMDNIEPHHWYEAVASLVFPTYIVAKLSNGVAIFISNEVLHGNQDVDDLYLRFHKGSKFVVRIARNTERPDSSIEWVATEAVWTDEFTPLPEEQQL